MASFRDEKAPPGTAREKGEKETTPFGWTPGRGAAGWGGEDRTGSGFGADGTEFANEIVSEEEEDEKDAKARDEETANNASTNAASAHTNDASAPDVPRRATIDRASAGAAPPRRRETPAAAALRARLMGGSAAAGTPGPGAGSSSYAAGSSSAHALPSVAADGRAAPGAFVARRRWRRGVAASVGATRRAPRTTQRFGEDGVKSRYYRDDDDASLGDLVAAAKHGRGRTTTRIWRKTSRNRRGSRARRRRARGMTPWTTSTRTTRVWRCTSVARSGRAWRSSSPRRRSDRWMRIGDRSGEARRCCTVWTRPSARNTCTWRTGTSRTSRCRTRVDSSRGTASSRRWRTSRAPEPRTRTRGRRFKLQEVPRADVRGEGDGVLFLRDGDEGGIGRARRRRGADAPHAVGVRAAGRGGGARAPMYFKKAIDESESEWSTHDAKKCISTAPPKGREARYRPTFRTFTSSSACGG